MAPATMATVGLLVGTGIQAYSQYSAGQAQARIARYNYAVQSANARLQMVAQQAALSQQRAQSQLALRQAEVNQQMANNEAAQRERNARLIRLNAESKAASSREDIRRKRLEYARFKGTQRNRIAASGVVDTSGSPLELLAETAGQMELAVTEMQNQASLDWNQSHNQAELEDYGARSLRAGASAQFGIERAASKIREVGFDMDAASIRSGYRAEMADANIRRMVGFNNASGQKMAAAGTLIGGGTNFAYRQTQMQYQGVA